MKTMLVLSVCLFYSGRVQATDLLYTADDCVFLVTAEGGVCAFAASLGSDTNVCEKASDNTLCTTVQNFDAGQTATDCTYYSDTGCALVASTAYANPQNIFALDAVTTLNQCLASGSLCATAQDVDAGQTVTDCTYYSDTGCAHAATTVYATVSGANTLNQCLASGSLCATAQDVDAGQTATDCTYYSDTGCALVASTVYATVSGANTLNQCLASDSLCATAQDVDAGYDADDCALFTDTGGCTLTATTVYTAVSGSNTLNQCLDTDSAVCTEGGPPTPGSSSHGAAGSSKMFSVVLGVALVLAPVFN